MTTQDIEFDSEGDLDVVELLQQTTQPPVSSQSEAPPAQQHDQSKRIDRIEGLLKSLVSQQKPQADVMGGYEAEVNALIADEKRLLAAAAQVGPVVRSFGPAQFVTCGDFGDQRLNGLVVARIGVVDTVARTSADGKTVTSATKSRQAVGCLMFEVWGYLVAGKRNEIGMLAAFPERAMSTIINLRSDLHVNPSQSERR